MGCYKFYIALSVFVFQLYRVQTDSTILQV
ncbi:hypothetical protein SAMN05444424_2506 [Bittarella massiliensis (ex Durand et al. 2017)]|uniref:Uncharacterized protein n=1 Tax=Bittarella massiliensis (ex Durand et al. 2017) TaxID=1720313 RepID=A0AAQ1RX15_9FIRM|nr:hypothetical protein SAMN05444424_2506 [Bittarella massiliensis (ex Durand et al. 2017)]